MSIALGGCLRPPPLALGLTEDSGGHLTYVWGAAAALAKREDVTEVEIVTRLFDDPTLGPDYAIPVQRAGSKLLIRRIDSGNRRYLSKDAATADRRAFTAALIVDLERRQVLPDVVHAHFADAAEVALAIRDRFGIPFIYTAHSLGIDKADHCCATEVLGQRIDFEDRAIARADAIIASSRDEAERQLMRYPSADAAKIHRVAPGAGLEETGTGDLGRARTLIQPFLRDLDRPIILAIARPVNKKNLALLVDVYATTPAIRERANLVIVAGLRNHPGDGEQEQREVIGGLLERLDRHDLYGQFALPKRHEQADIAALYELARQSGGVFVNPAATEPYGLTLTEAGLHGLPVVATKNGGAADIIGELDHGLLADPEDPATFGVAIDRLLQDRVLWEQASRNGAANAKKWSWAAYASRFTAIAKNLVTPSQQQPRGSDLLLSDIDGTLTGCRVGAAALIDHLSRRPGLIFGVATGRSLQEAQRILDEWDYPKPRVLATAVGSEIYWREGNRLVSDNAFADHLAQNWDAVAVTEILRGVAGLTPQAAVEQRRFKRSWFADSFTVVEEVKARLSRANISVTVIFSHGNLLDVLPARAGKAAAMRWITTRLGLPASAIFAAGDSENDRDMLEDCANAIVVANHCPTLVDLRLRPNVHFAARAHAGGIVDALALFDASPDSRLAA